MSKAICTDAITGAREVVARAEAMLARTIEAKGADHAVGFPDTAYYLPIVYSLTGRKVERLSDLEAVLQDCRNLLPEPPSEEVWLPYLGDALDAGVATLFAFECIEACKVLVGPNPRQGIWLGAASDVIMRERGIEFVDGTAPGFAAVVGAAPDSQTAVRIARELQEKNLYVFMAGHTNGVSFAEQLHEEGVQLGWETRLVPFGKDVSACVYALGFANRAALSFGGVAPGDFERNLRYNKNRIFAFVMALGEVTEEKYAAAAGAINYGFPTIADTDIPEILPTGVCTYEHVVSNVPYDRIVERALEVRGCKVKVAKVPVPVPYGAAFEGERIRKKDVQVEFGGNITPAFEFVQSVDMDSIDDGAIEIIGQDIDEVPEGSALPLAIWVEVAGRKMQPDFEPILERQIHHLLNGAEGLWHMGQRDIIWTRISKTGFQRGLRLRHYGEILHARFLSDYPAIVDKVKVTLVTDEEEVKRRMAYARKVYVERNHRLAAMTDESVDTFYSCLLCQSFAPNHVCIITPERLGLCGAYNWLDGKAAYEIDETGPNQPVQKGRCLDPVRGVWEGVNEYVYTNSHRSIESFTAYSIMSNPMTSCGCFECIIAYVPECNGVMVVNREFMGETPTGMTFSTLAGMVGGGVQTPGFMGVGKAFLSSRKFLYADGGFRRIVWMPKELKEAVGPDLQARAEAEEYPHFLEKICDETIATDPQAIREYLERVKHPVLEMPDLAAIWADKPVPSAAEGAAAPVAAPKPAPAKSEPKVVAIEPKTKPEPAPAPSEGNGSKQETRRPAVQPATEESGAPFNRGTADLMSALFGHLTQGVAAQLKETILKDLVPELKKSIAEELKASLLEELKKDAPEAKPTPELKREILVDVVGAIAGVLGGIAPDAAIAPFPMPAAQPAPEPAAPAPAVPESVVEVAPEPVPLEPARYAAEKLAAVTAFAIPREKAGETIECVTLGATAEEGGTRKHTLTLGGQNCLPFHHFEGQIPNAPALALEVFDRVSPKLSPVLREVWGDLLEKPAEMAKKAVEVYGAQAISVRLEGTHPEKGNKSPDEALALVKDVLAAVDVPIIVTGHSHFDSVNEVMKKVAQGCAGERLLLNWVEGDNYRTIAGVALAYGHCVVGQTPIDVNLAKQLNILLANMEVPRNRIVMDPLAGALGYGLEYTYSVMERIRLTGFGGDKALTFPMIVHAGQEAWKTKESSAPEEAFPLWGDLNKRAVLWEVQTAMPLILAGADLVILHHPGTLRVLRRNVEKLMKHEKES